MIPDKEIDFCLLIPCYNNFAGLVASLQTVEYPTSDHLILVVDDGSDISLDADAIKTLIGNKPLVVIRNETNQGITRSLNNGLTWIKSTIRTRYIARLDCADICEPERFVLQVGHLEEHPETGLVGSWCLFEEKGTSNKYTYKVPASHEEIVRVMHFRNAFIHPTIMFRTDLLEIAGLYPEDYDYAEDYAFCWNLIKVKQSFVFQCVLVKCEINKQGLSFSNKSKQLKSRWKIVRKYGTSKLFKIIGLLRLVLLFLLPKELILLLKNVGK